MRYFENESKYSMPCVCARARLMPDLLHFGPFGSRYSADRGKNVHTSAGHNAG